MKTKLILLLIFFIAIFLRFYNISINPPSLTWDEAAWGYNAYSIGIDGRDEFGRFLPITYLESFGDYKPPVYAYLSVLPVKIFGLNEFSTRFASAFLGSLTVIFAYFLTYEIFYDDKKKQNKNEARNIALITSIMLAISPWHILLSRAAFEANVATFFIILGVFLFFKSINNSKRWLLILSVISLIISMYTFNTARIVSPFLFLALVIKNSKILFESKKESIISIIVGVILLVPLALFLVTPQAKLRFQEVNIFSDVNVIERVNQEIKNDNNVFWSKIIHNRRFAFSIEYLRHYFDNLSPSFLFIKGDGNPKFSIQDVGQMYIWEVPFFTAGIFLLIRKRNKNSWFIFYWLLLSIIPAAIARETPHALRIESSLPTFQIISALGLCNFIFFINSNFKKYNLSKIIFVTLFLIIAFNFLYFINNYFYHYPRIYSGEWQYGYKDAISYINNVEKKYDNIYFTNVLGRPYIYMLFYGKYSPVQFREEAKIRREAFGFVHIDGFGKYHFVDNTNSLFPKENNLYIDVPGNIPSSATILKNFYLLNGKKVLSAYIM